LSNCLSECLTTWDIPASKVFLIASDNGANMVKAIRLLKKERAQGCDLAMMVDESDTEDETDEDDDDDVPLSNLISVTRSTSS